MIFELPPQRRTEALDRSPDLDPKPSDSPELPLVSGGQSRIASQRRRGNHQVVGTDGPPRLGELGAHHPVVLGSPVVEWHRSQCGEQRFKAVEVAGDLLAVPGPEEQLGPYHRTEQDLIWGDLEPSVTH